MKNNNKLLIIIVVVLALFHIFLNLFTSPDYFENIATFLKDLSIIITVIAPFIVEKVFKIKLSDGFKTLWIIFIFMAHYVGVILGLYDAFIGYDKIVHTVSGILTAYAAILIIGNKNLSDKFKFLFVVAFAALCAVSWEAFEFVCNILVGGDAQRVLETGVSDTMLDMIVALLGSICFMGFYLINKKR